MIPLNPLAGGSPWARPIFAQVFRDHQDDPDPPGDEWAAFDPDVRSSAATPVLTANNKVARVLTDGRGLVRCTGGLTFPDSGQNKASLEVLFTVDGSGGGYLYLCQGQMDINQNISLELPYKPFLIVGGNSDQDGLVYTVEVKLTSDTKVLLSLWIDGAQIAVDMDVTALFVTTPTAGDTIYALVAGEKNTEVIPKIEIHTAPDEFVHGDKPSTVGWPA